MNKKLRIVVLLIILAFSFTVKAEVMLEIDCNTKEISTSKSAVCEGNLIYETEGINDIEFDYQTNLNIEFNKIDGFTINNTNSKVIIHSNETLYDDIMGASTIMKFTLSMNDSVKDKGSIVIDNIRINNSNEIVVEGVREEFNISNPTVVLDSVCTLDKITIDEVEINGFSKDKTEYRGIEVTNEVIYIDAVRTSNKSSASGLGGVRVPKGETIQRDILVEAEDGTKNTYKLFITNITPKDLDDVMPDETPKSDDNTLKSLELYNGTNKIDLEFDSKVDSYNITIDEVVDKLTIKATLNDDKSSFINNYGPRDVKLSYGDNKVLVKVKAENNEEKTITLNINYIDNRSKDNTLSSLIINSLEVDLTGELLEVSLPYDTLKTEIEAVASSDKAVVEYENIELQVGDNEVVIKVTSEDGEVKEYKINVKRIEKTSEPVLKNDVVPVKENNNSIINIICYIVFGVGILSLVASIIYVIKKK